MCRGVDDRASSRSMNRPIKVSMNSGCLRSSADVCMCMSFHGLLIAQHPYHQGQCLLLWRRGIKTAKPSRSWVDAATEMRPWCPNTCRRPEMKCNALRRKKKSSDRFVRVLEFKYVLANLQIICASPAFRRSHPNDCFHT